LLKGKDELKATVPFVAEVRESCEKMTVRPECSY
jgi:hypothetical protein